MPMRTLKIGIIGCGKMGKVHAHWFSRHPNVKIAGFYNRSPEAAKEMAKKYPGTKVFSSWEDLIQSDEVDAIALANPSYEHLNQIKTAIKMRKHVFCEKPLALDIGECEEIMSLLKGTDCKVLVDFQLIHHPVVKHVNELIKSIGRVIYIDMNYSMYRTEIKWKHRLESGGGVLRELGGHMIDLANLWIGEGSAVTGFNRIYNHAREVEDLSINIIEYSSGTMVKLATHYYDRAKRTYQGSIYGEEGQIDFQFSSYDTADSRITFYGINGKEEISLNVRSDVEVDPVYPGFFDCFKQMVDFFVQSIEMNTSLDYLLINEKNTMQILDASYLSQFNSQKISLPLDCHHKPNLKDCFLVVE